MIDTHCHLDLLKKEDYEEAIKDSSLEYLITVGYDRKTIKNALRISQEVEKVYCAIGFHPHTANNVKDEDLDWLKELAQKNPKVKALGEMGLDFYKEYSDRKKQEDIFRKQIQIARELGIPIVVHSRDAEEETYRILKEEKAYEVGGVMHCFTGRQKEMKKALSFTKK